MTHDVRLITVLPYGRKTADFIAAFPRFSGQVETVRPQQLPHFRYDYETYKPLNYTPEGAAEIFRAHFDFYAEQSRLARSAGQIPMLVSGRFHEFSAPFLAALQAGEDVGPKVVSFDRHQDCHSNRFVAGGFWRWLIDQKRLKGNDLIMVGAAGRPILSLFREFLRDEVIAQAIEYYSSTKCDVFDFGPAAEEAAAAVAKRSRYRVRGPITPDGWQALQQRIRSDDQQAIAGLYALVTERKWVEDSGIRLVNDPEKAEQVSQLPAKGEKMFVSFDGDVCERPSVQLPGPMVWRSPIFTDRTVYGIFDLLRSARLFGLHVSELESPLCQLEPGELAQAMMG